MASPPTPPPPPSSLTLPNSTTPLYTLHKHLSPTNGQAILIRRSADGSILLGTPSPSALLQLNDNQLPTFSPPSLSASASPTIIRELMKGPVHFFVASTENNGIPEAIGAPEAAARVLNHENLVSLHGEWVSAAINGVGPVFNQSTAAGGGEKGKQKTVTDKTERWLIWDWCDAGTLKGLMEFYGGGVAERVSWGVLDDTKGGDKKKGKKGGLPKKDELGTIITEGKPSQVKDGAGFLPESLIWHVALGALRGLMFLHEGKRDVISVERDLTTGGFKRVRIVHGPPETEPDWLPILHRDVRAENICLQHPRGIETYGAVKLGGFENCYVSAAVVIAVDEEEEFERVPVVAMERDTGEVDERELRDRWLEWQEDKEKVDVAKRPYTRGNDLHSLGTILHHMMTGHPLPPVPEECHICGCHHIQFYSDPKAAKHCTHKDLCEYKDVNAEAKLGWLINTGSLGKYSKNLAGLVGLLLRQYRSDEMRASDILDRIAWKAYEEWKSTTPDGKLYKDATDDMIFRKNNEIVTTRNLAVAQQGGQAVDL